MSDRKPMNEGYVKRGGYGQQPSTPKPNIPPPSQKPPSPPPSQTPTPTQGPSRNR